MNVCNECPLCFTEIILEKIRRSVDLLIDPPILVADILHATRRYKVSSLCTELQLRS